MSAKPYYSLAAYFRQRFNRRVQKIPLDAGFDCPNRDGTISRKGCLFCNAKGSGSGLRDQGHDLAAQWQLWRSRYRRRLKDASYIAYLQSFSNTHGPISKLREVLEEIIVLPDLAGIAVGTRPDCLDEDKLALLASTKGDGHDEIWLELGLQSANDAVLEAIGRGHDFACFQAACHQAAAQGLRVCAHLIAGLPGENKQSFLDSVAAVNALPVHGVKFHNLYVCEHSRLAARWRKGNHAPLERHEYLDWLGEALALLRSDIVVQRLTGDPGPGELLAPAWAADKKTLLHDLHAHLAAQDLWQGKHNDARKRPPEWFSPNAAPLVAGGPISHACVPHKR